MAGKIFINYRRDDSIGMAGRLHDRLAHTFGRAKLFMDVDHIPAGTDFVAHLNSQVAECNVILVIIGPNWLGVKDESGGRRLDDPDDFVAIEIAAALARDIRVIPVLVDGARMPKASELPDSLRPLVRRHAVDVRHAHFGHDAEALVARMRVALGDDAVGPRRWRVRAAMGAAAVAVLLLIGWGGYAFFRHTVERGVQQAGLKWEEERKTAEAETKRKTDEAEQQRLATAKAEQDRKARAAAEAEAKRKTDEAEQQRLATAKAEQDRKARAAAEAEAKRKTDEAEQQRLATAKAEQDRHARAAAEAEAKRKADEAEQQRLAALKSVQPSQKTDSLHAAEIPQLQWKLTSSLVRAIPNAADTFVRRVTELSGGRIDIKLYHAGEIVPGLQVADAVSNNYVDLGYTLGHYYVAKDPAFAFLSHIPFGLEPRAHLAWRQRGDVTAIFNRFLAEYRIIAIPCGAFGRPEEFLSRKPIHSPAHLNGLKMRVAAWPARIYSALKVMPQQLAAGDIYPALENGTIDAVQWLTPRSTLMLGFNKVARYYYYPGVVVPAQIVDLFINKSAWDGLPPAAQQVLERACADAANAMIADYDTADRAALDTMRASGTEIAPLPDLVQKQLYDAYRQMSEVTPHNATVRSLIQTIDAKDTLAAKIR